MAAFVLARAVQGVIDGALAEYIVSAKEPKAGRIAHREANSGQQEMPAKDWKSEYRVGQVEDMK